MTAVENFTRAELALVEAVLAAHLKAPTLQQRVHRVLQAVLSQIAARPVLQDWVMQITMMQQTVLLTAIRGPDGLPKYGPVKSLLRWYRRCILLSAIDGKILNNPYDENGGSFTGPSFDKLKINFPLSSKRTPGPRPKWQRNTPDETRPATWQELMNEVVDCYVSELDGIPHHFHMHLMHAVEILGYKHPDPVIRKWWNSVYLRFVNDMHLNPETEAELDERLGDSRAGWLKRADPATAN